MLLFEHTELVDEYMTCYFLVLLDANTYERSPHNTVAPKHTHTQTHVLSIVPDIKRPPDKQTPFFHLVRRACCSLPHMDPPSLSAKSRLNSV